MGFVPPGETQHWVHTHYRSAFALLSQQVGKGALSGRAEWFGTREKGSEMSSVDEPEDGWATTVALRWPLWQRFTGFLELLHVESTRGARVRVANDVDAGLALLAARRPDALVSDVGMPGKDGYAFVREIRQRDAASGAARLPAVALTSFTREQDRREALAAGFDAHCGKPLKPLEIVRQLRVLVPRAGNT